MLWSSPPPELGGTGGGPGRPGGRGGAPPPVAGRLEEGEGGLELKDGGGGGMSRGIDGRWPPAGAGGGGGRSSGSGGLAPGAGGKGGLQLFGGGGGCAENPVRGPAEELPGGGGRDPCLPGGTLGGGGAQAWLGLGPAGSEGGGGPARHWKFWDGLGVLGTGGGGPPGVSCLDETLGRPLGRSGTPPREAAGTPGSLGDPETPPPPPKALGPLGRGPGGKTGPRLGPESSKENQER